MLRFVRQMKCCCMKWVDVKYSMKRQEVFVSKSPKQTVKLAALFARELMSGTRYFLSGSVGSGKSTFCRGFIREVYGDDQLEVPSPSYLLQNIYDEVEGPPIHHYDLYRLEESELSRLDLEDSFRNAVSLIEWPERLGIIDDAFERLEFKFLFQNETPEQIKLSVDCPRTQRDMVLSTRVIQVTSVGHLHTSLLANAYDHFIGEATSATSHCPGFN